MHKLTLPLTLALLFLAACSKNPTGPSDAKTQSLTQVAPTVTSVSVAPAVLLVQRVANPFCPAVAPFIVPFDLVVAQNGQTTVLVTDVTMRFTDTFGTRMPPVTVPAPTLNARFGSTLVVPGVTRVFPLSFPLGCGVRPVGVLVVTVTTTDGTGRDGTSEIKATVH